MSKHFRSYLCPWLACFALLLGGAAVHAQQIFLDPDTVNISTGAGTQFELDLRVDANTQGIRLFQVFIAFDTTKLDTVSTALGPLFSGTPYTKIFNSYIYYDSTYGTTILRLEGLLFGATAVVDGPGVVADLRLITKDGGTARLDILHHVMTDINNDPLVGSTAAGAVVVIEAPLTEFGLISPALGEEITVFPDSSLHLVWHSSTPVYFSEDVLYRCEVSSSATFDPGLTLVYEDIPDTTFDAPGDLFSLNKSYWYRVTAYGVVYGNERESSPYGRSFYLRAPYLPPGFFLKEPPSGDTLYLPVGGTVEFVWGKSASPYPAIESVLYELYVSSSRTFEPAATVTFAGLADTNYAVGDYDLDPGKVYWRVRAYGSVFGTERFSIPAVDSFYYFMAGAPFPFGLMSPVDGGLTDVYGREFIAFDWDDAVSPVQDDTLTYVLTLANDPGFATGSILHIDSVRTVSQLQVPSTVLPLPEYVYWRVVAKTRYGFERQCDASFSSRCFMRGDTSPSYGSINVGDLTLLIAFLFRGGPAPAVLESADCNCGGDISVSDLTLLIGFLFRGGPGPYCP